MSTDDGNCGGSSVGRDNNMSHNLRDDRRALFFNQQSTGPTNGSEPKSSTVEEPIPSTSSAFDNGRMLKRPSYSMSGFGNSKPIASSLGTTGLYQGQPPRIIGSSSANFGGPKIIHHKITIEPQNAPDSSKITIRPSPTSSTATTTPTSTAPGSGTHQPVETQMPTNRNGASSGGGSRIPSGGGTIPGSSATNNNNNNNNNNMNSNSVSKSANHSGNVANNHHSSDQTGTGGGTADGGSKTVSRFATATQQSLGNSVAGVQLTLYGWRKKCLYSVILVLMIMIIINLALTLWILKVMEFSSDGMGQLKIVSGGIQLTGQALVLDILRASSIRSKHGQPISIESSRNFSINTRDSDGYLENQLFLGHDRLEVLANNFRVADTHGTSLFSVDRDEVSIGATSLRVEGEGGVIFKDSIQTPLVRAEAGKDLKLESPTRSLEVRATQEIFMQSRAGSIEANCLNDLKLHSVAGSIRLDASNILLPNLKTVQPLSTSVSSGSLRDHGVGSSAASSSSSSTSHSKIYQLCACSNGKLFLAPAHSICATDDSAICR
ncbi:zeta-sarcoglycan isoform X2 [Malaya genurostris]|uniref:zeta-sarcoglycan isoform X2 n=1 Tax=Malaya genurostris TaxID=325434 RepID=UPI0026F3BE6E|nr:zeta-sarcoglycan isoform X2 [Malaya genurostris]